MFLKILGRILTYFLILTLGVTAVWLIGDNYQKGYEQVFSENKIFQADLSQAQPGTEDPPADQPAGTQDFKPLRDWTCQEPDISALSAISIEEGQVSGDKILFNKDESRRLPMASLTKLMTALIVLENYNLDEITTIKQDAVSQGGPQGKLNIGDQLSVRNLLYIMLIESSNEAAYALAEMKGVNNFIGLMNDRGKNLGLLNTNFADVDGLSPNNYSTADDLAKFAQYLLENDRMIWQILSIDKYDLYTPQGKFYRELINTNQLLGKIPDIIGGKTGLTEQAKGCLLLILKNPKDQNNIIYVVLGSDDRFGEMQQLINWVNKAYTW